jgi:hypothetical protein
VGFFFLFELLSFSLPEFQFHCFQDVCIFTESLFHVLALSSLYPSAFYLSFLRTHSGACVLLNFTDHSNTLFVIVVQF